LGERKKEEDQVLAKELLPFGEHSITPTSGTKIIRTESIFRRKDRKLIEIKEPTSGEYQESEARKCGRVQILPCTHELAILLLSVQSVIMSCLKSNAFTGLEIRRYLMTMSLIANPRKVDKGIAGKEKIAKEDEEKHKYDDF